MRRAKKTEFVKSEDDKLIGVYLPGDYCAQHEWGIDKLKGYLDIDCDASTFGVDARRIRCPDDYIFFHRQGDKAILVGGYSAIRLINSTITNLDKLAESYEADIHKTQDNKISGAWDERDFAVYVKTSKNCEMLQELYDAINNRNALLMLGGGLNQNPFSRAGLALGIIDRVPKAILEEMYSCDESLFKLNQAAKKTGVFDKISKRDYFALRPEWHDPKDPLQSDIPGFENRYTKHKVIFWLNPSNQKEYYWGRVTVEELEEWSDGKGFIVGHGREYTKRCRAERIAQGDYIELYSDEGFCLPCKEIVSLKKHRCPKCNNGELITKPPTTNCEKL